MKGERVYLYATGLFLLLLAAGFKHYFGHESILLNCAAALYFFKGLENENGN